MRRLSFTAGLLSGVGLWMAHLKACAYFADLTVRYRGRR